MGISHDVIELKAGWERSWDKLGTTV